jgi:hypothetical protein
MITMICRIETHRAFVIASSPVRPISISMASASALNDILSAGNNNDGKFIKTHLVIFVLSSLNASLSAGK